MTYYNQIPQMMGSELFIAFVISCLFGLSIGVFGFFVGMGILSGLRDAIWTCEIIYLFYFCFFLYLFSRIITTGALPDGTSRDELALLAYSFSTCSVGVFLNTLAITGPPPVTAHKGSQARRFFQGKWVIAGIGCVVLFVTVLAVTGIVRNSTFRSVDGLARNLTQLTEQIVEEQRIEDEIARTRESVEDSLRLQKRLPVQGLSTAVATVERHRNRTGEVLPLARENLLMAIQNAKGDITDHDEYNRLDALDIDSLIEIARSLAGRTLTEDERRIFFDN